MDCEFSWRQIVVPDGEETPMGSPRASDSYHVQWDNPSPHLLRVSSWTIRGPIRRAGKSDGDFRREQEEAVNREYTGYFPIFVQDVDVIKYICAYHMKMTSYSGRQAFGTIFDAIQRQRATFGHFRDNITWEKAIQHIWRVNFRADPMGQRQLQWYIHKQGKRRNIMRKTMIRIPES